MFLICIYLFFNFKKKKKISWNCNETELSSKFLPMKKLFTTGWRILKTFLNLVVNMPFWMFTHSLSCSTFMSSSFNDVTFLKVYLESTNIFFHVLQWCHHPSMMSHSGKFILNVHSYSFMYYSDVIILQWCHILESLFRIFKHILSCFVMSSSFNDFTFWKVYLESSNIFFHVLQWCHHPLMMSHTGTLG